MKKIESVASILSEKYKRPPKKVCAYQWQDRAFEIAEKLGIDWKTNKKLLPQWLKFFKLAYNNGKSGRIDNCYSFLVDYSKDIDTSHKIKLFYWRFNNNLTK